MRARFLTVAAICAGLATPAMAQSTGVEALHVVVRTFVSPSRSILLHDVHVYSSLSLADGQAQCSVDKKVLQAVYGSNTVAYTTLQLISCQEATAQDLH